MTKKGFTLIELLVVIVIIGILATIGVAQFSSYFAKARDAKRVTAIAQVRSIIMAEAVEAGGDYSGIDAVQALTDNGFAVATDAGYAYGYAATAGDFVVFVCEEASADDTTPLVKSSGTISLVATDVTCDAAGVATSTALIGTGGSLDGGTFTALSS